MGLLSKCINKMRATFVSLFGNCTIMRPPPYVTKTSFILYMYLYIDTRSLQRGRITFIVHVNLFELH